MKTYIIFLASVFLSLNTIGSDQLIYKKPISNESYFIENKGQWNKDVLYLCRMKGMDFWITTYGFILTYYEITSRNQGTFFKQPYSLKAAEQKNITGQRIIVRFINNNTHVETIGKLKQKTYFNYFYGNNPEKHQSNVSLYKEVLVKNIFHGVDIRYYFDCGFLRFDFIVHPGVNPEIIRFKLEGQDKITVKEHQIMFTTIFGETFITELNSYQAENLIPSRFIAQQNYLGIHTGNYDKNKTLIIDPIIFSAFIGGVGYDESYDIAVDRMANVYITGQTCSPNFDTTAGTFQVTMQGEADVFVSKFNPTGSNMIFSTFIGGVKSECAYTLAIDDNFSIWISGETSSEDFPATSQVYQNNLEGKTDIFLVKLNSQGNLLIFSTMIGGDDNDVPTDLVIDSKNNIYLTGFTYSPNFPVTTDAFQQTLEGGSDGFVIRFNGNSTEIEFATLLGGKDIDIAYGIALDNSHCIYLTGLTLSQDFDITNGTFQTYSAGGIDGFITKMNSDGSSLIFSTYMGSSDDDLGKKIIVDTNSNIYIVGYTNSANFPVSSQVIQSSAGGNGDVFLIKLNSEGNSIIFSTFLGGSHIDYANDMAMDKFGNIVITGMTSSTDFPTLGDSTQLTFGGGYCDAFMCAINSTGTMLLYSTFAGGEDDEWSQALAIDVNNEIYVTGMTYSQHFHLPENTFHSLNCGDGDVFVIKYTPVDLLPVEYLNIRAYWEGQTGVIEWTTANENNSYGFYIERMINNQFVELGFIPSSNDSIGNQCYRWYDESLDNLTENLIVYRIKQLDYNGKLTCSPPVYLIRRDEAGNFSSKFQVECLYPNPVRQGNKPILIINAYAESTIQINIMTTSGNIISKIPLSIQPGMNKCEIPTDKIEPGNYFLSVYNSFYNVAIPLVVMSD